MNEKTPSSTVTPKGAPFQPGDRVRSSSYVIQRRRDHWLSCGRQPEKTRAKDELDRAVAARGTVISLSEGKYAPWIVCVRMDGETGEHNALPGLFERLESGAT